jgi:2-phosphosulfolactate phosphatase
MTVVELAWGPGGARALATECPALVVVDVLSFTTCVSIATARGASVRPVGADDDVALADGEVLAGEHGRDESALSLSPLSMLDVEAGSRVVLPSPNGAAIAAALTGFTGLVVAACLRNVAAVGGCIRAAGPDRVGIIAAGERWADGSLRPSYEDLVGAGAIAHVLGGAPSPQASAAAASYLMALDDMTARLMACRSGVELVERGFTRDVELAAELDADNVAPVLCNGVFAAT